jgi:hypothetical protein
MGGSPRETAVLYFSQSVRTGHSDQIISHEATVQNYEANRLSEDPSAGNLDLGINVDGAANVVAVNYMFPLRANDDWAFCVSKAFDKATSAYSMNDTPGYWYFVFEFTKF